MLLCLQQQKRKRPVATPVLFIFLVHLSQSQELPVGCLLRCENVLPTPAVHSSLLPSFFPRNLSNNKVSEIEDGAFEGAASVTELHLTANQLESVRSAMFRGLDGLRTL